MAIPAIATYGTIGGIGYTASVVGLGLFGLSPEFTGLGQEFSLPAAELSTVAVEVENG